MRIPSVRYFLFLSHRGHEVSGLLPHLPIPFFSILLKLQDVYNSFPLSGGVGKPWMILFKCLSWERDLFHIVCTRACCHSELAKAGPSAERLQIYRCEDAMRAKRVPEHRIVGVISSQRTYPFYTRVLTSLWGLHTCRHPAVLLQRSSRLNFLLALESWPFYNFA